MPEPSSFRRLNADKIHETLQKLHARIRERFPERGLTRVAGDLTALARLAGKRANRFARRHWARNALALVLAVALVALLIFLGVRTVHDDGVTDLASFLQTIEAGLGTVFFLGAVVVFLWTWDARRGREKLLEALDEIRSFAHVVDMHALTKNPEKLLVSGEPTESSPEEDLTLFELNRYLDYCTELLDLSGKIAAVYVRDVRDPLSISAADEIEHLTGGLSRKIWQKVRILGEVSRHGETP